jgi:2-methylcitrate dehydratase PrpD
MEREIEAFTTNFDADTLSDRDRQRVCELLVDQLGVQVGLSTLPWSEAIARYARDRCGAGSCTIVASDWTADPRTAALVNGTFGHGFEYDDAHGPSDGHPGSAVIPAAFAVAEQDELPLSDVATAIVAGYEVYAAVGRAGKPELIQQGWQPHAVVGAFGAIGAVAQLYDLSPDTVADAFGIAASLAGGITEFSSTGGSVKRVHAGLAARNGLEAVQLARAGITGSDRYLTGSKGLFRTFIGHVPETEPVERNDEPYAIHDVWLKRYSCCGCTHAYIDAVRQIDPGVDRIETVTARVQLSTNAIVGLENDNLYEPTGIEEAQFSLPFEVALALLGDGNCYAVHRSFLRGERNFDDSDLRSMMGRIDLQVDPGLDESYPDRFVGDLTVHYVDGTTDQALIEDARGTPGNQLDRSERRDKFHELVPPVLGADRSKTLWSTLHESELTVATNDVLSLVRTS